NLKYFAIWELYRRGKLMSLRKEMQYLKKNFGKEKSIGMKFMYDPLLQLIGKKRDIYNKGYTLRERLKYAIENELSELLRYADRNSMSHSVEVRLPFLSHQLVEYTFSVPAELLYHHGRTKYILREATKQIVPKAVYSRTDKIGFAPPDAKWMKEKRFLNLTEESVLLLKANGLNPGNDIFRNYIAGRFMKVFNGV
ncbi:MAG: asparagine synthase-related protein, partial [Bacteroidota bacterium]